MNREVAEAVTIHHVTVMFAVGTFLKIALQGRSEQTKGWYESRLRLLARFLGETRALFDVLEMDLIDWRESIERQKLSPHTVHGYIRAARRFFRWLYKRGMISADIAHDLYLPGLPRRGRSGISDKNALLILEEARRWSVRDYAMLLFFASTNARRGGVAGLRMCDVNLFADGPACRRVQVFEKGQKERTVIMDDETLAALRAWVSVRPAGSEYVFVTAEGKPLKVASVSEVIDRYKARLGIRGRCSPHQWRHRWFRRMLSNRMPLVQAAQLGGHENVELTYEYYGQFAVDELQDAYDRHYPVGDSPTC